MDIRHVTLLADVMTFKGTILGITRFGVAKMRFLFFYLNYYCCCSKEKKGLFKKEEKKKSIIKKTLRRIIVNFKKTQKY